MVNYSVVFRLTVCMKMHQICSLLQALLFRFAVLFSLKAKQKSKSKGIKAQLANCMRGHFGWRLCNACTCHFMLPVFSPLSPSSYFLLLHSWFLIPFFKKSINSSRHPWCPLVPISWMCARLYCFFFSFQPFFFFFFGGSGILLWRRGLPSERGGAASLLRLPQALLNI